MKTYSLKGDAQKRVDGINESLGDIYRKQWCPIMGDYCITHCPAFRKARVQEMNDDNIIYWIVIKPTCGAYMLTGNRMP